MKRDKYQSEKKTTSFEPIEDCCCCQDDIDLEKRIKMLKNECKDEEETKSKEKGNFSFDHAEIF